MMEEFPELPIKLDFEGAHNFRDIGGYPTVDGSSLRQGRLFRSDHLARLTDADQLLFNELGIRTVIDLRRESERAANKSRIDNPRVKDISLPVAARGADVQSLRRMMERGQITRDDARDYLIGANRDFIRVFSHVYRDFMHLLLEEDAYPIVFHCAAGKDRTGFATALIHTALGVSMEDVMHDYLATNHLTANYVNGIIDGLADVEDLKVTPEGLRALMSVEPIFLQTAFDTAAEDFGGIEAYIEQALEFDQGKSKRLRELLCE